MLLDEGRFLPVDEARLSTVYDGDGRQRSAGLELWLHGRGVPAARFRRRGRRVVAAARGGRGARRRLPLAPRRPRRHRRLRADVAQRAARSRMTRALISDFGGVLTSPLQEGFLAYQEESGVSLEELGIAMARATEEHGDHPLFVLERGEITETRVPRAHRGASRVRLRPHEAAHALLRAPDHEPHDDRLHRRAARGAARAPRCSPTTCASGSRSGARSCRRWTSCSRWSSTPRSSGMRKPDPAIYELTLERLGGDVQASDCVFVDDLEVNCEAARALGHDGRALRGRRAGDPGDRVSARRVARRACAASPRGRARRSCAGAGGSPPRRAPRRPTRARQAARRAHRARVPRGRC